MKAALQSRHSISLAAGLLILASMACGLPASPGSAPAAQPPASTEQAPAGQAPATLAYVGNAGAGDPLDLCTFPTPDEVQAVLGGPAARTFWFGAGQNCTLFLDDTHFLIVQAGHDADGKTLHVGGMEGVRNKITDQSALQLLDEIQAQQANLTMLDLVRKGLPVWRAAGFSAVEDSGADYWGFWFYGSQMTTVGGFNLGEYGVGRASGAWLAVYVPATDEATAKAVLKPLAAALLARLPDNFTPTGTTSP